MQDASYGFGGKKSMQSSLTGLGWIESRFGYQINYQNISNKIGTLLTAFK